MHNGKVPKVFSMFLIVPDNILQKNNIILQKKNTENHLFLEQILIKKLSNVFSKLGNYFMF